jgi:hypothetical protein
LEKRAEQILPGRGGGHKKCICKNGKVKGDKIKQMHIIKKTGAGRVVLGVGPEFKP